MNQNLFQNKTIGFAMTGSFCSFDKIFDVMADFTTAGATLVPIVSDSVMHNRCRFGETAEYLEKISSICGLLPIHTLETAEPIGPNAMLDLLIIAPCTGNTLAKLACGITDGPVLMAAKAHLRNNRPILISLSTNDGMGANFQNLGTLFQRKNVYFVPIYQDNYKKKPHSLVADTSLLMECADAALHGVQLQPFLRAPAEVS
ncbi:MAG: dipicolinate synthase subunit B [Lachnospiraceae bacterium]|nr:dipicolinate synthase subunit B [Lachnospiraceae bacterium]